MHPYIPERITYWPAPSKLEQPDWSHFLDGVDSDLASPFDDIYVALNNELRVLAAIGVRTVFERAAVLLSVDPNLSFPDKIEALHMAQHISGEGRQALGILVEAGNAAAHRGWKPKSSELNKMLVILESFLHRAFIVDEAARHLKGKYPPRPGRSTTT